MPIVCKLSLYISWFALTHHIHFCATLICTTRCCGCCFANTGDVTNLNEGVPSSPWHEDIRRAEVKRHTLLTPTLCECEWSPSRFDHIFSRERATGFHWIGCWLLPRAVLDMVVKRSLLLLDWNANRLLCSQPFTELSRLTENFTKIC